MEFKTIEDLHAYFAASIDLPIKKTATQPVFGDGNPKSPIVFIGEAPGKTEDAQGKPFIGGAGKFLAEMLAAINLQRNDVYITNIVKYRPPNNRDPELAEKQASEPWLYAELNFIAPRLVIFLGRHSMNDFFPDLQIGKVHGKLIHKKFAHITTEYFLPLYHPASALYNGGMRQTLMDDFVKIPAILKKISASESTTKNVDEESPARTDAQNKPPKDSLF